MALIDRVRISRFRCRLRSRAASELYQLTRKYQIASLPLQQRGKDRKGALPEQALQSTSLLRER
jgi:hypothetical protein